MPTDTLARLNRILITTPEHAYAVPPMPRTLIAAAAREIADLRRQVADLETAGNDMAAIIAATAGAAQEA